MNNFTESFKNDYDDLMDDLERGELETSLNIQRGIFFPRRLTRTTSNTSANSSDKSSLSITPEPGECFTWELNEQERFESISDDTKLEENYYSFLYQDSEQRQIRNTHEMQRHRLYLESLNKSKNSLNNSLESANENCLFLSPIPNTNTNTNKNKNKKGGGLYHRMSDFKNEVSTARTFSFLHELETLLEHGLIKGGDLNNAIVYVDKPLAESNMDRLKKAFNKESISVTPNGILDNLELHYPNEAARHKLLDVVGDLALIGIKIRGKVIAEKPGHSINAKFAQKVSEVIKSERKNTLPKIDLDKKPLMDSNQIMKVIPHRPPFLLIDEVLELSESHVIGLRRVEETESWVKGHFPGAPVMPGVLQVEFMAQAGGVLVLNTVPDPENYLTFFMKMDKCKFKNPVVPGDTLICKLELISPIRRGIIHMYGQSFVGNEVKSEGEFMAKIVKKA